MPQFEVFRKRMTPLTKQPYVTIQKGGIMSLNRAAHAALGAPEAIELLYDPTERIIGLRKVDPSVEHAFKFRAANNDTSFVVSILGFSKYYEIPLTASTRRAVTVVDGVLCVDLKDPGTEVTSNRNGRSKHGMNGRSAPKDSGQVHLTG